MNTETVGVVNKCPNCGAELGPYDAICPFCKYVINGKNVNNSVAMFKHELEEISREVNDKKSIFFRNSNANIRKLDTISSFPVPNTIEDISEMIMAISVLVDSSYYFSGITAKKKNKEVDKLNMVLEQKLTQLYNKAKISFGNSDVFKNIEGVYQNSMELIKKRKRKKILIPVIFFGAIALVFCISMMFEFSL